MLELIKDNRTGNKLEIVVMTYNEESRINNILGYYGNDFDIVLLDDNSTDRTVELAINAGATVFRRMCEVIGEGHFVNYVNNITKSGCCFYLFADEFIDKKYLHITYRELQNNKNVVLGRRRDWYYGKCMPYYMGITPRGLYKGCAIYNPNKLHASLEYIMTKEEKNKKIIFDVDHFHVWSSKKYFGTAGLYAYSEVSAFLKEPAACRRLIRRFLAPLFMLPIRNLWGIGNIYIALSIYVANIIVFFIALFCLIEQKFLMSPDGQLEKYSQWYR